MQFELPNEDKLEKDYKRDQREANIDDRVPLFFFPNGQTIYRILPPVQGSGGAWYHEIRTHGVTVDEQFTPTACPKQFGNNCPICEVGDEIYSQGGEQNVKLGRDLRPRERYLFNIVVVSGPPGTEVEFGKVYVLQAPKTVKRKILELDRDRQLGYMDVTGIYSYDKDKTLKGVTFRTRKQGTGFNTRYSTDPLPHRTDLIEDLKAQGVDYSSLKPFPLTNDLVPPRDDVEEIGRKLREKYLTPVPVGPPNIPRPEGVQPEVESPVTGLPDLPDPVAN